MTSEWGSGRKAEWEQSVEGQQLGLSSSVAKHEAETQRLAATRTHQPRVHSPSTPYPPRPSTAEPQGNLNKCYKNLLSISLKTEGNNHD